MAEAGARARNYNVRQGDDESREDDNEPSALPTPEFDAALRLAHHAQRLKALEIGMENFSRAMTTHATWQQRMFRRQTVISLAIGGICLAATLITGIALGLSHPAPAPQPVTVANVPATAPIPAPTVPPPAMPIAQPQPQPVQAPTINTAQPPASIIEQPALEMPAPAPVAAAAPVALGRLEPPARPRKLSTLENAVTLRLAATAQTVPATWTEMFTRETAGDPRAKLQIAAKFLKGEDVKSDPAFALMLIRQAANAGNKEAMMWLAYSSANGSLGKPDPVAAAHWFQEAAKAGVTGAYAELGKLYEKGIDGAPDPETALSWYQRAARIGDSAAADAVARINRELLSQKVLLSAEPPPAPVAKPALPPLQPAAAMPQVQTPAQQAAYANTLRQAVPVSTSARQPDTTMSALEQGAGNDPERAADIRAAQRMLKVLGYKLDKSDGTLGPQTVSAIKSYQRDHAAYPDGQFTPELLESLTRDIRFGQ